MTQQHTTYNDECYKAETKALKWYPATLSVATE